MAYPHVINHVSRISHSVVEIGLRQIFIQELIQVQIEEHFPYVILCLDLKYFSRLEISISEVFNEQTSHSKLQL